LPYPRHRLTHTTADGYFTELLELPYDIVLNIDEDCFVADNTVLEKLLEHFISQGYGVCGIPDSKDTVPHRTGSPDYFNACFNIFDLRQIRALGITTEQYLGKEVDVSPYAMEAYYPFFRLLFDKLTWFTIPSRQLDFWSTELFFEGEPFLYHAWCSRLYDCLTLCGRTHRARIDELLERARNT
jgi:hypothetical protein